MSSKASDIPEIIITKPSALIQIPPVTPISVQESALSPTNECVENPQTSPSIETCSDPELDVASISPSDQIPPLAEAAERQNEEEFSQAEECNDCLVPVHESRSESDPIDTTPGSSESDADEFRTNRCCNSNLGCKEAYLYMSSILGSSYAIAVWLILMALPLSAGIMGSIYMFSCPACVSLPNMVFMTGVSMMGLLTLRVCIIIHRIASENENFRSMLHTLNVMCMFITMLFYLTESVSYWKMESIAEQGNPQYCNSTFTTYAFWWNIATPVLLAVILLFPIV